MKLPKPKRIITEKYIAGLSLFKSKKSPIKLSANESALGASPKAVKAYNSVANFFLDILIRTVFFLEKFLPKSLV